MSEQEFLKKLIVAYQQELAKYEKIHDLARSMLSLEVISSEKLFTYLNERLQLEKDIQEYEQSILEEKAWWIENREKIDNASSVKTAMSELLKKIQNIMFLTLTVDSNLDKKIKENGLNLSPRVDMNQTKLNQKRGFNQYKKFSG